MPFPLPKSSGWCTSLFLLTHFILLTIRRGRLAWEILTLSRPPTDSRQSRDQVLTIIPTGKQKPRAAANTSPPKIMKTQVLEKVGLFQASVISEGGDLQVLKTAGLWIPMRTYSTYSYRKIQKLQKGLKKPVDWAWPISPTNLSHAHMYTPQLLKSFIL